MTEATRQSIRRHAAEAAEAAIRGENVPNPYPDHSEESKVWNTHFNAAMAALHP
jgi:hypothetical protein